MSLAHKYRKFILVYFRYFELRQLPNFFLAGPILFTLAYQCYPRLTKYVSLSLKSQKIHIKEAVLCEEVHLFLQIQIIMKEKNLSCLPSVAVVAHGAFLTVFCFTSMHVQVRCSL